MLEQIDARGDRFRLDLDLSCDRRRPEAGDLVKAGLGYRRLWNSRGCSEGFFPDLVVLEVLRKRYFLGRLRWRCRFLWLGLRRWLSRRSGLPLDPICLCQCSLLDLYLSRDVHYLLSVHQECHDLIRHDRP